MKISNKQKIIYSFITIILILALSACSQKTPDLDLPIMADTPTKENLETDPALVPAQVETETPKIVLTPTPDMRISAEKWQEWPIIPIATNRAIEIYQSGLEKSVNLNAFSKIGDCQNVKESFMGIYDTGIFFLQDWQKDWQETVDHFKGFYNRDSFAFGQGLNVAAALSPLHADPAQCMANENPIQCELRVTNPAFAIIRFERWYPDVTPPETYEKYLRQILDIVIENGTVPILMTKADNVEGGHQINAIIAKLAYEYDIPLFNWWRAAQALPHRGLDPARDDKFHIDPEFAWTEQSAFGLGTLDSIWKGTQGK